MYLRYIIAARSTDNGAVQLKQIHIKLPDFMHRDLRIQAAVKELSLQDYVVQALETQIAADQSINRLISEQTTQVADDDSR